MKSTDLQRHITATYINLRIGVAALAIILPLVLWIGGRLLFDLPLQASMSAYYHAGDGAMRDVFVGVLIAVGAFLYLYKGFTILENTALNLAGLLLVGVALFPMDWNCGNACGGLSLHGTFAILFFLSIAYVCIFRASDTLDLIEDETKVERYKSIRFDQARCWVHSRLSRRSAFAVMRSFLISAVSATFAGLPASRSILYLVLRPGLKRAATKVGM